MVSRAVNGYLSTLVHLANEIRDGCENLGSRMFPLSERMNMSYRRLILMATLVGLVVPVAIADDAIIDKKAPLFDRIKMRGKLRDDVSPDVIKQTPGEGYQLRVVEWWPKKGVDYIEAPKTEPRTWTIRPESAADEGVDTAKWWPLSLQGKKQFKAHLLGFRGIGLLNSPWDDDMSKPVAPNVVLRLPDGRKRCFTRGSFSDEDEMYIAKLYDEQMKVLLDNTFEEGFTRLPRAHDLHEAISDNPLYPPGTTHISSKHFTATLGSEPPDDGGGSRWLDRNDKEGAAIRRKLIMEGWENWWAYLEHGGHLMFFSEKLGPKYKYALRVGGTKKYTTHKGAYNEIQILDHQPDRHRHGEHYAYR